MNDARFGMKLPWLCPACGKITNPAHQDECSLCGALRPIESVLPAASQDRHPNFRGEDGRLRLIRCFICEPVRGRENLLSCGAAGVCASCGWSEENE